MNERTRKRDKLKKTSKLNEKNQKTINNKKTIIKYTKTVKNWVNTNRMNNKSDKFVH